MDRRAWLPAMTECMPIGGAGRKCLARQRAPDESVCRRNRSTWRRSTPSHSGGTMHTTCCTSFRVQRAGDQVQQCASRSLTVQRTLRWIIAHTAAREIHRIIRAAILPLNQPKQLTLRRDRVDGSRREPAGRSIPRPPHRPDRQADREHVPARSTLPARSQQIEMAFLLPPGATRSHAVDRPTVGTGEIEGGNAGEGPRGGTSRPNRCSRRWGVRVVGAGNWRRGRRLRATRGGRNRCTHDSGELWWHDRRGAAQPPPGRASGARDERPTKAGPRRGTGLPRRLP